MLAHIIYKNCFTGHRNTSQQKEWQQLVMQKMESEELVHSLKKFSHQSSFLVFFIFHLKEIVIALSQNEDLELIENDFNLLILKYRPLAAMIIDELIDLQPDVKTNRDDLLQQLLENLLLKKDKIEKLYDGKKSFKNYIWSIIKNESKNLLKAALNINRKIIKLEDGFFSTLQQYGSVEAVLSIEEALNILHIRLLLYTDTRAKMVICLGVIYNYPVFECEIDNLIFECGLNPAVVESKLPAIRNRGQQHDNILARFETYREILNLADQSRTNASSYWRWTNLQITKMIHLLNEKHLMAFDKDTFKLLVEFYFQDYYDLDYPELQSEFVYVDKTGERIF